MPIRRGLIEWLTSTSAFCLRQTLAANIADKPAATAAAAGALRRSNFELLTAFHTLYFINYQYFV